MNQLHGLLDLFFPQHCIHCDKKIVVSNRTPICYSCEIQLDSAFKDGLKNIALLNRFKGILPLHFSFSLLYFTTNGVSQTLIHEAKYKGQQYLFSAYGKVLANKLKFENEFLEDKPQVVIPVPNHWLKKLSLSYNQAELFASEISSVLEIPMNTKILRKSRDRTSQTKRTKIDRLQKLFEMYSLTKKADQVTGKHVLLVDDVITSGATIEICCQMLLKAGVSKISICSFMLVK